jgi:hypothetical protein
MPPPIGIPPRLMPPPIGIPLMPDIPVLVRPKLDPIALEPIPVRPIALLMFEPGVMVRPRPEPLWPRFRDIIAEPAPAPPSCPPAPIPCRPAKPVVAFENPVPRPAESCDADREFTPLKLDRQEFDPDESADVRWPRF